MEDHFKMSIEILERTNDGDSLTPQDLAIVEGAVNGFLTDEGKQYFRELHSKVMSGSYKKPWFHDIENLTIDNTGFVYWKGKQIEHYNLSWAYTEEGKKSAQNLAERCRIIESRGQEVNTRSVVWDWVN